MTQSVPDDLKTSLPSIEEIAVELVGADDDESWKMDSGEWRVKTARCF